MARVPLIEEKEHPELSELIAKIRGARGGRLINIYRLMLHSPALANAWFDLNQSVRYGTEIDGQCRELAVIRVAILNKVEYVVHAHGPACDGAEARVCIMIFVILFFLFLRNRSRNSLRHFVLSVV
jgi:hypothetical protein